MYIYIYVKQEKWKYLLQVSTVVGGRATNKRIEGVEGGARTAAELDFLESLVGLVGYFCEFLIHVENEPFLVLMETTTPRLGSAEMPTA